MLLGEILTKDFEIERSNIDKALQFQSSYGGRIGNILLNMGIISEDVLISALSKQLDLKIFSGQFDPCLDNIKLKKNEIKFLIAHKWLPFGYHNGKLIFLTHNPLDIEVLQFLQGIDDNYIIYLITGTKFSEFETLLSAKLELSDQESISWGQISENELEKLKELATEAPVVNLVNSFITRAIDINASDLHFEPYQEMYRVRCRIDGLLKDIDFLPLHMELPVVSRIKIMAGMDIAEKRRPQDGKISMKFASKDIEIRVSTLPLSRGESVVLRFLVKDSIQYSFEHLGLAEDIKEMLLTDIRRPFGVIILSGPTGSGKTTTLYTCLNTINTEEKKIVTIEDPVEYKLEGINQIQVNPEIGYDFLTALRSILRQDPDVIMVGEIRDGETARAAMQSALTGHLVFSTVHTQDAQSIFIRLLDLGVEEYLVRSSLIAVASQRLVRKLCPRCATLSDDRETIVKANRLEELAKRFDRSELKILDSRGCKACNFTGFKGRTAIMEYIRNETITRSPKHQSIQVDDVDPFEKGPDRTLLEDGFLKVIDGVTTIAEVIRVCST